MYFYPYVITELTRMVIGVIVFFTVFVLGISIIGNWLIFKKAGEHPWASVVPFYGSYVLHKMTWGQGWMFLVPVWPVSSVYGNQFYQRGTRGCNPDQSTFWHEQYSCGYRQALSLQNGRYLFKSKGHQKTGLSDSYTYG